MMKSATRQYALAGIVLAVLGTALMAGEWQCDGHWLRFRGKPILLVGDSITQGWMELGADFDQRAYVDALARRGINVLLLWSYIGVVDQAADPRIGYDAPELWPWVRTNDKFDLMRFNDASYGFDPRSPLAARADQRDRILDLEGHLARFFRRAGVNFTAMKPEGGLASTGVCLAHAGVEYVVYAPQGKAFTVNLAAAKGTAFIARWYDPRSGQFHDAGQVIGGNAAQPFTPRLEDDAVLLLKGQARRP